MSGRADIGMLSVAAVMMMVAQGIASMAEPHFVAPPLFAQGSQSEIAINSIEQTGSGSGHYLEYGLAAVGVGAALFALDEEIKDFSQWDRIHTGSLNDLAGEVGNLGTTHMYVATGIFLVGYGALTQKWKGVKVCEELAAGFLLEEGITRANKSIFGRQRPYRTNSQFQFFKGGTAFTSGHSATVFTFATIMAKSYPRQNLGFIGIHREEPLVPILAYSMAGLVGLQRLYVNAHWISDVYGGALVGYGVGSAVVYLGKRMHLKSIGVVPGATPKVSASFDFGPR